MGKLVWLIVGATFPYSPEAWSTKAKAYKRAAQMRRRIRAEFASATGNCGIAVESRSRRDYLGKVQS